MSAEDASSVLLNHVEDHILLRPLILSTFIPFSTFAKRAHWTTTRPQLCSLMTIRPNQETSVSLMDLSTPINIWLNIDYDTRIEHPLRYYSPASIGQRYPSFHSHCFEYEPDLTFVPAFFMSLRLSITPTCWKKPIQWKCAEMDALSDPWIGPIIQLA